ncbi:MAG TPA: cadherin-like beta sandwich domain-containing protein, partial [Leptospiraceae bacterium]|nr:cadherin-like beta sandwich domain-containing protein [Leptospiraceae bacterium]
MIWFIRKLHFLLIIMFLAFILNCSHDDSFKIKLVLPLLNSNSSNTATTSGSLTNLVPSTGTLSPSFSSTVFNYTMSVGNSVSSIQFTPTSSDTTARITINGATVSSGASS